ncbi:MAG: histidine kinase dimerization/phospho-acceptor domain-containing protein [Sphingomonas sp.]
MSYELRTPLTSIKGFAEMLHGGYAARSARAAAIMPRRSWSRSSGSAR